MTGYQLLYETLDIGVRVREGPGLLGLEDDVLDLLHLGGRTGGTIALLVPAYLGEAPLGYLEMLGALA